MHIPPLDASGAATVTETTTSPSRPIAPKATPAIVPGDGVRAAAVGGPADLKGQAADPGSITRKATPPRGEEAPAGSPAARPPDLTAESLEAMPRYSRRVPPPGDQYNLDGRFAHLFVGALGAVEHPVIVSFESRIEFVNKVADWLHARPVGEHVTVVSIGSGYLLTEELIHLQLSPDRQSSIAWRCMDTKYGKDESKGARVQFLRTKKDARLFTTAGGYLAKRVDGEHLATLDKSGPVLILLVDPPTPVPGQPAPSRELGIELIGQPIPVDQIDKANAVLMAFEPRTIEGEAKLRRFASDVATGRPTMRNVMKCTLAPDGTPRFEMGKNVERMGVDGAIATGMKKYANADMLPIEKLYASVDSLMREYNKLTFMPKSAACVPFSDFALSVEQIVGHFAGAGGPVTVARLENSEISFTEVHPPAA